MLIFVIIFLLLGLIAILPVLVVALGRYEGTLLERIETVISTHDGLLASLGTLFLVSALAVYTTHLAGKFADKRERENRNISAQLKLAEFRQIWISEMRDDISELLELSFHSGSEKDIAKAYQLSMKIEMRLNLDEPLARSVSECLVEISKPLGNEADHKKALANLVMVSRKYLKTEWARLKRDIETAQLLGEA